MENKTSKYFKYAIGEIILVVIGILIALQINNWNEKSQSKKSLRNHLVNLKQENGVNIRYSSRQIKKLDNDITDVNKYLTIINTKIPKKINDSTLINLTAFLGPKRLNYLEDAVYKELLSSDLLKTLKDEGFKENLFLLKGRFNSFKDHVDELLENWVNDLKPYYIKHGELFKMTDSIRHIKLPKTYTKINRAAFINNKEFNNILMDRLMSNRRAIQRFEYINKRLKKVDTQINDYLKDD